MTPSSAPPPSPWHDGERAIQQRLGVAQRMEAFGRKVIRDAMPDQHRQFYAQLPMLVLGTVDADGRPWASVLEGAHGFAHSPDPKTLRIGALPAATDPAHAALAAGAPLGLLGIELHTRRRNRLNGRVAARDAAGLTVAVEQAFGNCPQYIRARGEVAVPPGPMPAAPAEALDELDDEARTVITGADTFFVASYADPDGDASRRQVDASHRGGKRGFVQVEGHTLTIPDFAGNLHFNTLGNLLANPRAGLLFIDFDRGDLLQLTGRTEIVFDGDEVGAFQGAERSVSPRPTACSPARGSRRRRRRAADATRHEWRPLRITRLVDESSTVRSFHLEPADGTGTATFRAGQHLPIRVPLPGGRAPVVRTYTVSSAPSDAGYRISVKRQGAVSRRRRRRPAGGTGTGVGHRS